MLDQSVWPERVDRRVSLLCFQKPRERGTEEDPIPCSDQGPQWQPLSTGGVGASLWEAPRVKCTSPWPRSRGVMTATKDLLFSGYFQAINHVQSRTRVRGSTYSPRRERKRSARLAHCMGSQASWRRLCLPLHVAVLSFLLLP